MFFMNQECTDCFAAATELALLAQMLRDQPKVGRADCTYDFEVCDLFVNHHVLSNATYPLLIMVTE
mgnify:CR=1 FL=1